MIFKELKNPSVNEYGYYDCILPPYFAANGTDDQAALAIDFLPLSESGSVEAKVLVIDGVQNIFFTSADTASTSKYILLTISTARKLSINVRNAGGNNIMESDVLTEGWHTVKCISTGSAYGMEIDGETALFDVTGGVNDGNWFADVTSRNNITAGSLVRTSTAFGISDVAWLKVDDGVNGHWVFNNPYFVYDKSASANHLTISGSGSKIAYGSGGYVDLAQNGYSLWEKAASPDIQVPLSDAGAVISLTPGTDIPAGYTKSFDVDGGSKTWNMTDALIDFDAEELTDSELDIFDRSNATIQTAASRASDYYDAANPYRYHVTEITDPTVYDTFFNATYQDRVFAKIELSGTDIVRYDEQLNYATKKTSTDLTTVTDYCGITDIYP